MKKYNKCICLLMTLLLVFVSFFQQESFLASETYNNVECSLSRLYCVTESNISASAGTGGYFSNFSGNTYNNIDLNFNCFRCDFQLPFTVPADATVYIDVTFRYGGGCGYYTSCGFAMKTGFLNSIGSSFSYGSINEYYNLYGYVNTTSACDTLSVYLQFSKRTSTTFTLIASINSIRVVTDDSKEVVDAVDKQSGILSSVWNTIVGLPGKIADLLSIDLSKITSSISNTYSAMLNIPSKISGLFNTLLQDLFVPSDGFIDENIAELREQFGFVDFVMSVGSGILNSVSASASATFSSDETKAPAPLTISATYRGKEINMEFFDLSFYAPYKPYVDGILSAFMIFGFGWRMYNNLPSTLAGVSSGANAIQNLEKM